VSHPGDPPVRQKIREAVEALGIPTTNAAVCKWVQGRYPATNLSTIRAQIVVCTVNHPSRTCYPENHKPRPAADARYDLLYRSGRGRLELYDPDRHGTWRIAVGARGTLVVCCDGGVAELPEARTAQGVPLLPSQVKAAGRLYERLMHWRAASEALDELGERFPGFDHQASLLKCAAINELYFANVLAIARMAYHVTEVMKSPPGDPIRLVETIAMLPAKGGGKHHRHWSFAAKFGHFFVDADHIPMYDSYSAAMVLHHLGKDDCVVDTQSPVRAFVSSIEKLRQRNALSVSLRELDRYLWLSGQYREWLEKRDEAKTNTEARELFEHPTEQVKRDLHALIGSRGGPAR
jgi:hypothetical protein